MLGMRESKQLIIDEGLRLFPYKCPSGKITIGVGRNLEGNPLTPDECMHLLLSRPHIKIDNNNIHEIRSLLLADFYKNGITKDEAMYLFENDLKKKSKELFDSLPWLSKQPEEVQNILLNMAFQMGISGLLKFKNTLTLIKYGHYKDAANRMSQSLWAKQTPARAKRLIDRMYKV